MRRVFLLSRFDDIFKSPFISQLVDIYFLRSSSTKPKSPVNLPATRTPFIKNLFLGFRKTEKKVFDKFIFESPKIHYSKMDDKKIDFLQVTRKTSNQLNLISTQLKMAEVVGTIYQGTPNHHH